MLTRKGKYGLKAMVYLAAFPPGKPILIADIAETNDIPRKFLDSILNELRKTGFVDSRKGKGGGYALARAADKIVVGDIVRALDGPLAPIDCASKTRYRPCDDCINVRACTVRLIMLQARDAIAGVLDTCTLADMREMSNGHSRARSRMRKTVFEGSRGPAR